MAITWKELEKRVGSGKRLFYVENNEVYRVEMISYDPKINDHRLHKEDMPCGAFWHGQLFVNGEEIDLDDCVFIEVR